MIMYIGKMQSAFNVRSLNLEYAYVANILIKNILLH